MPPPPQSPGRWLPSTPGWTSALPPLPRRCRRPRRHLSTAEVVGADRLSHQRQVREGPSGGLAAGSRTVGGSEGRRVGWLGCGWTQYGSDGGERVWRVCAKMGWGDGLQAWARDSLSPPMRFLEMGLQEPRSASLSMTYRRVTHENGRGLWRGSACQKPGLGRTTSPRDDSC